MTLVLKKLSNTVTPTSPRALVALLLVIHVIAAAIIASPEVNCAAIISVKSIGHFAWSQLSSPSPPAPAGNITMKVVQMWANHFLEVEIPRLLKFANGSAVALAN
jgi:hypothetical protein